MTYVTTQVRNGRHVMSREHLGGGATAAESTGGDAAAIAASHDPTHVVEAAHAAADAVNAPGASLHSPIAAVHTFQTAYGQGLTVDGIYGPNTRAALLHILGPVTLPGGTTAPTTRPTTTHPGTHTGPSSIVSPDMLTPPDESQLPSWAVPAMIGTAVVIAGGLFWFYRRPVRANRRVHRNRHVRRNRRSRSR